jgi:micrococcal nuclease
VWILLKPNILKNLSNTLEEKRIFSPNRWLMGRKHALSLRGKRGIEYGRLLAYVYLLDGTFLNAEIIKQGYGSAYTRFPFKYKEEFRRYEREARENRRGLWR